MCAKISENIKVIKLNYDNLTTSTYSVLLASTDFWNKLTGDKILLYQEDTCIFKSNIEDFLDYDYVGAPWPKEQNDNSLLVGNGGFSLRSKKAMIDVINSISLLDTKYNSSTVEYLSLIHI